MPRRRPSRGCQASALLCHSEEGAHLQERQTARCSGLLFALPPRRRDHSAALALLPYASCALRDHPARRVTMPVRRCPSARAAQLRGNQGPHRSMMRLGQGSHEACQARGARPRGGRVEGAGNALGAERCARAERPASWQVFCTPIFSSVLLLRSASAPCATRAPQRSRHERFRYAP